MKRACIAKLVALALLAGPGMAQDQKRARELIQKREILPLGRILPTIKKRCGGRVLDVRLTKSKSRYYYKVKVLQRDGTLRTATVDAKTGRIQGKC